MCVNWCIFCPLLIWKTILFWRKRKIDYFARRHPNLVISIVCGVLASVLILQPAVILANIVYLESDGESSESNKYVSTFSQPLVFAIVRLLQLLLGYLFILRVWLAFYDFKKRNHLLDLKWKSHLQLNLFGVSMEDATSNRKFGKFGEEVCNSVETHSSSGSNTSSSNNNLGQPLQHKKRKDKKSKKKLAKKGNKYNNNNNNSVTPTTGSLGTGTPTPGIYGNKDSNINGKHDPWTLRYDYILGHLERLVAICSIYWLIFTVFCCFALTNNVNDDLISFIMLLSIVPFIFVGIFVIYRLRELKPDILEMKNEFGQIYFVFTFTFIIHIILLFTLNDEASTTGVLFFVSSSITGEIICLIMVWRDDPENSAYSIEDDEDYIEQGSKKSKFKRKFIKSVKNIHINVGATSPQGSRPGSRPGSRAQSVNVSLDGNELRNIAHELRMEPDMIKNGNDIGSETDNNGEIYEDILIGQLEINRSDSFMRRTRVSLKHLLNNKHGFKAFASHCVIEYSIENLLFLLEYMQVKQFLLQKKYVERLQKQHVDGGTSAHSDL